MLCGSFFQVSAMQRDSSTYCDEPEDTEDYASWCSSFDIAAKKGDIAKITSENAFMGELQSRIVPIIVEYEDFWTRYFYRWVALSTWAGSQAICTRVRSWTSGHMVMWFDALASDY